ncbi:formate dehydrogenase subunit gamma [Palleronia marisminoris]|uniref:Formate dehydrogenase, nitrate-inducible, cytochrome b556(Fdn) subunit n=1 Tax=Palleronia marisminoris TaxID=315423 RepID=A0A1Y5SHK3_9RHOB|nr:formate dehydrogenase subunit gamma [Palleronia marisminoris]SFG83478.1 formate dehydrogenase subunit gamma [Palleronia marisminoris]SLN41008.1 Formate dehydrogenase, nitrate-inducible, cytochrome b556(Fdn) subunit [Palleronia marisminoris]
MTMTHAAGAGAPPSTGGAGYRIGGAIVALVLLVLLAVQVFEIFDDDARTIPEYRWGTPPISNVQSGLSGVGTDELLRERATLQGPREVFGPSPENQRTYQVGSETQMISEEIETPSALQTLAWSDPSRETLPMVRGTDRVEGISSLPYVGAEVYERPFARDWRLGMADFATHLGALAILGFAFLLAAFLAIRGRVPISSGKSGRKVERFGFIERATHWMTSGSFVMLALTGIVIAYGDTLILPFGDYVLGQTGWLATWGHMMFFPPFALGILTMFILWIRDALPSKLDLQWLKQGGGLFRDDVHPSARRFNAGQKLIFWSVILGGGILVLSGITLMFPFFWLDINGMGWVMLTHAIVAVLMIAVILGHIYIGSVGMQGAFWAMWTGDVDRNMAAEHHDLWLEEIDRKRGPAE